MNFNLKKSQEELGLIHDAAMKLVTDSEARGEKTMPAEINAKFDELMSQHGELEKDIQRKLDLQKVSAEQDQRNGVIAEHLVKSIDEFQEDVKMQRSLLNSYLKGVKFTPEQEAYRAQTTQTTTSGGFLIETVLQDEITNIMSAFGGVRSVAKIIKSTGGNPIDWVVNDDTANNGAWLAENTASAAQDAAYTKVTLNAYKASADYMLVPFELLADSNFDMVSHINELMATRLFRRTENGYSVGTGSAQPTGISKSSAFGATTDVTLVLDFDDILDLKHSVDSAYRNAATCHFMMNDNTLRDIKKVAIASANQSLWQPGIIAGEPSTIDGNPYVINNDLGDIGTAQNHPMFFGNFQKYIIRDAGGMEIKRSDHLNILADQATFVGFMRTDGKLVDSNAVKHMRVLGT
jgi:HK97 family phage major capsid protein